MEPVLELLEGCVENYCLALEPPIKLRGLASSSTIFTKHYNKYPICASNPIHDS